MYVDISRVVACSQQAAFDYMADPRNDPNWWEAVLHTTIVSTTTHGVGTTYQQRCKLMGHSFDVGFVVTAYDRPSMLRLETTSGAVRFEAEYHVTAVDGGTRIRMLAPVRSDGLLFRLLGPVFRWYLLRTNERYFDKLKQILDASATAAG